MKPQALLNTILALPLAACLRETGKVAARAAAARDTQGDPAPVRPPEDRIGAHRRVGSGSECRGLRTSNDLFYTGCLSGG